MVEPIYKPTPFKERESENLKVKDYAKEFARSFIPIIALVGGYQIGRMFKYPRKENLAKGDKLEWFKAVAFHMSNTIAMWMGMPDHRGPNVAAGSFIASIATLSFLNWKRKEKRILNVADTVAEVKDVAHLHQSNDDIEKDNVIITRLTEFEKTKQAKLENKISHLERLEQKKLEPTSVEIAP